MIEIRYVNGHVELFEIYNQSKTHIAWKDCVDNIIRIDKQTNLTTLFYDGEWIEYDSQIASYRVILNNSL